MSDTAVKAAENFLDDDATLQRFGLAQELDRSLDVFANFGLSYSVICIVAGGITSFGSGFATVGGAAIGLGWPMGCLITLTVALAMSHIASAFPTAGGLYHWSQILGGRGWGWFTGWTNILGLLFVTAAIDVGAYQLIVGLLKDWGGVDLGRYGPMGQFIGVLLLSFSQALINGRGIRLVGWLSVANIYIVSFSAIGLAIALIYCAPDIDLGRLVSFKNFSGAAGGDTWPAESSMTKLFLLSLLLPGYTITGFDASAHASEETLRAANEMPRALLISVVVSAIFGYFMVASFVLAMPDMAAGAAQGSGVFGWLMARTLPPAIAAPLSGLILVANYICGLAAMTSTSRMIFAFARGGEAPASRWLRQVSKRRRTPRRALWVVAGLVVLATAYGAAYSLLASASVILLYISYGMPLAAGLVTWYGRGFAPGPFNLARGFPVAAALGLVGIAVLIYAGIQPPNDGAVMVMAGLGVLLGLAWLRRRYGGGR